jgi:hypothetical protein
MVQNIIFLLFSIYFERKEREPLDYSGREKILVNTDLTHEKNQS